jgi:hypothetical protein
VAADYFATANDIVLVGDCFVVTGSADHQIMRLISGFEFVIARSAVKAIMSATATEEVAPGETVEAIAPGIAVEYVAA